MNPSRQEEWLFYYTGVENKKIKIKAFGQFFATQYDLA
jgi:hypothetical protein